VSKGRPLAIVGPLAAFLRGGLCEYLITPSRGCVCSVTVISFDVVFAFSYLRPGVGRAPVSSTGRRHYGIYAA